MPDGRTVAEHLHDMELLSGVGIYEVDLSERLDEPVPVATLSSIASATDAGGGASAPRLRRKPTQAARPASATRVRRCG